MKFAMIDMDMRVLWQEIISKINGVKKIIFVSLGYLIQNTTILMVIT
jgi:hypothetical protein